MGRFDGDVSVTFVTFHLLRSWLSSGPAGERHPSPVVTLLPTPSFYLAKGAGRLSEGVFWPAELWRVVRKLVPMGRTETLGGTQRCAGCSRSYDVLQSLPSAVCDIMY